MYQPLIWAAVAGDEASGLAAALDAQNMKRSPDALVDGMRGDMEFVGDLLGRQMLVDQEEAIKLASAQSRHAARHNVINLCRIMRTCCRDGHPSSSQTQLDTAAKLRPSQQ
ncbi:hypothetical protein [Sphingomonas sp.]|uniref:hypothetical protein n=1 Tax=Sphingomonas sp. TaxID=28214 RepID=UPI00286C58A9|nr:hypothetical protein [Sphingomonas sp.]